MVVEGLEGLGRDGSVRFEEGIGKKEGVVVALEEMD